jgi:hypothetical protein
MPRERNPMDYLKIIGWMFLIFFIIPLAVLLPAAMLLRIKAVNDWYEKNQSNLKKAAGALILLLIAWYFIIGVPRGNQWSSEGTISVFPQVDSAKNYRLDATISATVKGKSLFSNYNEYKVDDALWPDGGHLNFRGSCIVSELKPRALCLSDDNRNYYVEVTNPPENNSD